MAEKLRLMFFFRNSFSIYFQPKTSRNHPNNLFKPIFNLQKRKKLVKNPKSTRKPISSRSQIWFLGIFKVKKHPSQTFLFIWNHLRKKSNILVARVEEMIFFSLQARFQPSSLSLISPTKNRKIMKIKFSTRMKLLKIKRTDHLIANKYGG